MRISVTTTAALTVLGATEALLGQVLLARWRIVTSPGPSSLDEALSQVVVAVAVGLGGWLVASTAVALLAQLPGRLGAAADRWALTWAPAWSRRVAAVLVGAAVGTALAPGTALGDSSAPAATAARGVTATAAPDSTTTTAPDSTTTAAPGFTATISTPIQPSRPASGESAAFHVVGPGWTPSRPVQRPQPSPGLVTGAQGATSTTGTTGGTGTTGTSSARAQRNSSGEVVVLRGDTLWDIARSHLGPGASDAEVAEAWPAWYDANRAVIGDDPDVIRPGQILRQPTVTAAGQPAGDLR
jgi:hypothetical protein